MFNQSIFYSDKQLDKEATTKDFQNTNKKYYWDGNNGDKWEVTERFGHPITFVKIKCLDQNKEALFQVEELKGNSYFPTNNK